MVGSATPGGPLVCRGWEQEGILRCLLNNLDPNVAEDVEKLVVYGGKGRAARSHKDLNLIVEALKHLGDDETLIVQSGAAVAVLPTHPGAPRAIISSAMLVPAWSDSQSFWNLEARGLTMYGQMTAGGWFYIGTQGVLGFTYETFLALGRKHFDGKLAGKRVLTAGLGGMGGAQGFAIPKAGARALIVEVDEKRARRRASAGWVQHLTHDYDEAIALLHASDAPEAIALIGNIAEVAPRLLSDGVHFDAVTDQTAAHDALNGYVPIGYSPEDTRTATADDTAYLAAVKASMLRHGEALLEFRRRGSIVFEYGNNLRDQVRRAGLDEIMSIPGFVNEYVRPIFASGVGPFRWIALSGDDEDLRKSEDAVLEVAGTPGLEKWFELARAGIPRQGLPARICWLGLGQRDAVCTRLNELVAAGEIGPLALGRDHMDPASVASPLRETEGMLDGSDAIADWPVLSAMLNCAQGATWVAVGNGGGVGVGNSIHTGMVVVADGTPRAAEKIRRVFWTDPALGVARYADAGYDAAIQRAAETGLNLPRLTDTLAKRHTGEAR
nr:urocanate hydratase [Acuticoccus mangrovi]